MIGVGFADRKQVMTDTESKAEFYAAANSKRGFFSLFDEIFDERKLEKLYIIKGGSGTGKSRLMREIAEAAEHSGFAVEYYYCSSDPKSLDGIIIKEKKLAVIDGTAPHTRDPHFPGAVDEIINLGEFWDTAALESARERIIELCDQKKAAFERSYSLLSLAGKVDEISDKLIESAFDFAKLEAFATRFVGKLPRDGGAARERAVFVSAISYLGHKALPTFGSAGKIIKTDGKYGASEVVMAALRRAAKKRGVSCTAALDPLDPAKCEALYFDGADTAVIKAENCTCGENFRALRFIDGDAMRKLRPELRRLEKMHTETLESAIACLKEAFGYHAELESIYSGTMDFEAKEAFTAELIKKLIPES